MLALHSTLAVILIGTGGLFDLFHCKDTGPTCSDCDTEVAEVSRLLCVLQTNPLWIKRDNAAHALRKVDWQCHPEVAEALATSLLRDRNKHVREEAAESLACMAPCLPTVHLALLQASKCDPDRSTRKWAARALDNLEEECTSTCTACGPTVIEGPIYEGIVTPGSPPIYLDSPPVAEPFLNPQPLPPFDNSLPVPETLPSEIPPLPSSAAPFGTSADRKERNDRDDTLARRDVETDIDRKRGESDSTSRLDRDRETDRRPTGGALFNNLGRGLFGRR